MATIDLKDIALLIGPDPQHLTDAMLYAMRRPSLAHMIPPVRGQFEDFHRRQLVNIASLIGPAPLILDGAFVKNRLVFARRPARKSRGWRRHVRRMKASVGT